MLKLSDMQRVAPGVFRSDPNHSEPFVVYAPELVVGEAPAIPLAETHHLAMQQIANVADHADPHVALQAKMSYNKLSRAIFFWLTRSVIAERARIREQLRQLGFKDAAEAIKNG